MAEQEKPVLLLCNDHGPVCFQCLPIVVQIPVFIALYWVLLGSVELRHAPFILWIKDLSSPDPYYLLPVLMGASMIIQTRLNPEPPDPVQAKVMMIMPVMFTKLRMGTAIPTVKSSMTDQS